VDDYIAITCPSGYIMVYDRYSYARLQKLKIFDQMSFDGEVDKYEQPQISVVDSCAFAITGKDRGMDRLKLVTLGENGGYPPVILDITEAYGDLKTNIRPYHVASDSKRIFTTSRKIEMERQQMKKWIIGYEWKIMDFDRPITTEKSCPLKH